MEYSEHEKYHEVLICPACKAIYIDGDGCPNYCIECEACKEMTELDDLDPTLLMEAHAEICHDCADEYLDELASHVLEDLDYKTKYPVSYAADAEIRKQKNKPVMGDYKGRTRK